ncbi:type I restriction-modification enzyme R subunit C-terminal domain-containing protein [Riemerella anatipestifer]|nr:type I restriction-modification enzyme R subunit C-terminal domain-containing protein [Riemerella anatipestifer]
MGISDLLFLLFSLNYNYNWKIVRKYEFLWYKSFVSITRLTNFRYTSSECHFARFVQERNLTADQMLFVEKIIHYLNKNGILDKQMLTKPPFNDQYDNGILGVFEEKTQVMKIIGLVDEISKNAGVA